MTCSPPRLTAKKAEKSGSVAIMTAALDEEVRACADHVTAAVENDGAAAVMRVVLERCGADGAR